MTFIETPPAGAILAAKELPSTGGDTLWTSGIAAYEALSVPFRQLLSGLRAEHDFRKSFPEYKYRKTEEEHQRCARRSRKILRCYIRWCERIR